MRCAWQVECDDFCNRVLSRHWPGVVRFRDIRAVTGAELEPVDLIAGGFPCQPSSVAGKRAGERDPRWLWPEFARLIKAIEPGWVLIENVPGLRSAGMRSVLADLASLGFDAEWEDFGAYEFGAPHRRVRLFVVATHPDRANVRLEPGWLSRACRPDPLLTRQALEVVASACPDGVGRLESARLFAEERGWTQLCGWDVDPLARVDDGFSVRLVGPRRRALGNTAVSQIIESIGRAIMTLGVVGAG